MDKDKAGLNSGAATSSKDKGQGIGRLEAAATTEVEDAVAFALASPQPPLEEIEADIYAGRFIE